MSDKLQNLKSYIRELVKEVEEELEESTTTGNVAGYQTPNAFGDDSKKSKKKTKDVATSAGYTVVNEGFKSSETKKSLLNLKKVMSDKDFVKLDNIHHRSHNGTEMYLIKYVSNNAKNSPFSGKPMDQWSNITFHPDDKEEVVRILKPILKKYRLDIDESINEDILKEYEYAPPKKDIIHNTDGIINLIGSKGVRFILKPETKVFQQRSTWIFTDGKQAMWINYLKPVSIVKKLGRAGNNTKNLYNNAIDSTRYNEDTVNEDDPCWKNYKQIGMKKKNGKEVPNCVPKESVNEDTSDKFKLGTPARFKSNGKEYSGEVTMNPEHQRINLGGTWRMFGKGAIKGIMTYGSNTFVVPDDWKNVKSFNESINEAASILIPNVGEIDRFMLKKLLMKNSSVLDILGPKEKDFMKRKDVVVIGVSGKNYDFIFTDGKQEFEIADKDKKLKKPLGKARPKISDFFSKNNINEGKKPKPRTNRWLELKNDETKPNKKLAMGLKELKYKLREVESFIRWYNKISKMNELSSDSYWKRTNNHIYKIKERLINIAKTIQELEK